MKPQSLLYTDILGESYPGLVLVLCCLITSQDMADAAPLKRQNEPWSVRMAESIMARNPNGYGDWDYVTGTVLRGFEELWRKTGDTRYYNYIKRTVDNVVNSSGTIAGYRVSDYNIDEVNEGRMVLLLYKETGEEKYKKAAELLRNQLANHPRTSEGGFWHKKVYPHQMWLDGLYMGSPFYAEYGKVFNEPADFDDVVKQLTLMEKHSRDAETGLLYHGWDESKTQAWADPVTGTSASFWGRAIGWYAMALVDVLDYLPEEHAGRDSVIAIVQRLAKAVSAVQDSATGVWWQVIDQGGREGNYRESSVSCMLVYFLAKALRLGYIEDTYQRIAEKGYQGILDEFISENSDGTISLNRTCVTAGLGNGRDGSYEYYVYATSIRSNDGKALGPFITASVEMELQNEGTEVDDRIVPETIKLVLRNYPNPFNPATKIIYTLFRKTHVKLAIFNLRGQLIASLVDAIEPAGQHAIVFNARNLSNGAYVCLLSTSAEVVTSKMIYLK